MEKESKRTIRVLAWEENRHIRRLIRVNLERDGLAVCEAASEQECLYATEGEEVQLLLLSVEVLGARVVQVIEEVRATQQETLPVLLIVAEEPSPALLRALWPARYLRRPFDVAELIQAVRDLIEQ